MQVHDSEVQMKFAEDVIQVIQNLKDNRNILPPMYECKVEVDSANRMYGQYVIHNRECILNFGRYSADCNIVFVCKDEIDTVIYKRNCKRIEIRFMDDVGTGKKYRRYSGEMFVDIPEVPVGADEEFWFQYSTLEKYSSIIRTFVHLENLNTKKYKVPGFSCDNIKPISSILEYQNSYIKKAKV